FDRTRGGLDRRGRSQAVQARESIENPSVHPEGVPGLVLRETHLEEREVAALRSELDVDAVADVVADRVREPADLALRAREMLPDDAVERARDDAVRIDRKEDFGLAAVAIPERVRRHLEGARAKKAAERRARLDRRLAVVEDAHDRAFGRLPQPDLAGLPRTVPEGAIARVPVRRAGRIEINDDVIRRSRTRRRDVVPLAVLERALDDAAPKRGLRAILLLLEPSEGGAKPFVCARGIGREARDDPQGMRKVALRPLELAPPRLGPVVRIDRSRRRGRDLQGAKDVVGEALGPLLPERDERF